MPKTASDTVPPTTPFEEEPMPPNVVTLLGTSRPGNYTQHALSLVEDELRARGAGVERIDPAKLTLAFPGHPDTSGDGARMRELVKGASGVIIATPEYHGSFAAMTKLMIECLGFPSPLSGQPVGLLGVASGRIGAIKSLEALRGVCSHTGAIVLPGPVSVAGVNRLFTEDGTCTDQATEKFVRGLGTAMMDYLERYMCPARSLERLVREDAA
jgi:NAD(P)H-dependent FMN reductase